MILRLVLITHVSLSLNNVVSGDGWDTAAAPTVVAPAGIEVVSTPAPAGWE